MAKVTKEMALDYHRYPRPGKIEVIPTKPYATQADLALAYSPGVAYPCLEIKDNPDDVYKYTDKGNLVAVISNGTAVLGLGNIGALAGKPVMEGKGLLFKIFAGLDCFDIEVDETDPDKFIDIVKALGPTFGGINLEDIKAPECFKIEERLKAEMNIPVMHDDQHGTAIISAAALLNAIEIQGMRIVPLFNGAGAAAVSCTKLYCALGVKMENVVMCDSKGVISHKRTDLNPQKAQFATSREITTLAEAMVDADVFLGLSVKDVVTPEMVKSMAPKPIVFALANPDPEIAYETAMAARPDIIMGTGRSDYPNQINNVLGFPYIFRGALDCGASEINETMKIYAVRAIAELAKKPVPPVVSAAYNRSDIHFGRDYIIPTPFDPRLLTSVAPAVARGAMDSGVSRRPITDWDEYDEKLRLLKGNDRKFTRRLNEAARTNPKRVAFGEANTDNMLRAAAIAAADGLCIPILLGNEEMIEKRAQRLGLNIDGIEIVNLRHDREAPRRERYAAMLTTKRQRQGENFESALDKMFDRNYFGMMMVETGDADAFIAGTRSANNPTADIAREVIGLRDGFKHFAAMHVLETSKGTYFLADTMINGTADEETLTDITRLAHDAVKFFAHEPVMALVSYSNFGTNSETEPKTVHNVVSKLHEENPDMIVDGEMQVNYALNRAVRDKAYPFTRLYGKDVNTLVFPNLSAGNAAYRIMLEMGVGESIGPIQMGLKKPVHFMNVDAEVRDIINVIAIAGLDAATLENMK